MCTARFVTLPQDSRRRSCTTQEVDGVGITVGEKRKLDLTASRRMPGERLQLNPTTMLRPCHPRLLATLSQDVGPSRSQPGCTAAKSQKAKQQKEEERKVFKSWVLQNCLPRQWDGNGNEKGERISRRVLSGSKYGVKQTRGSLALGQKWL